MNRTNQIRKELKQLIREKQVGCATDKEKRVAEEQARAEINKKYGHGWKFGIFNDGSKTKSSEPSYYYGHRFGEHWMD